MKRALKNILGIMLLAAVILTVVSSVLDNQKFKPIYPLNSEKS